MDEEQRMRQRSRARERRRAERIRRIIVIGAILFFLIPFFLCIFLFFRIKALEHKLNDLITTREEQYFAQLKDGAKQNVMIAHAKEKEEIKKVSTPIDDIDDGRKKVYLTFDDGPSIYTEEILSVLKEHNVLATFFVIGKEDSYSLDMYKKIVEEGHTLAMHSYSHDYKSLYQSLDNFKADFNKIQTLLYNTTGIKPTIYRFPGGSSNTISKVDMQEFIGYLGEQSVVYFDWNTMNGDATGKTYTQEQLIQNVMEGVVKYNESVVLMHDTAAKESTVKSLPKLIEQLQEQDIRILPLTETVTPVQHVKPK